MSRAFVLAGGGNLGAVQVGMLAALTERGIAPDLLVGTSAGALNAAYLAGRAAGAETVEELGQLWRDTHRRDVFPIDPVRHLLALAGRRASLCSADGLRRLIATALPYQRLEDAAVPVHVTATNVLTGAAVYLGRGDAVTAVLASAAIPAVFPAVDVDGLPLVDGALAAALHAVALLIHQRLLAEVAQLADQVELHVLPPLCPVSVSPIDFSRAAELIERGHRATRTWLADGGDRLPDPERFLALHHHTPDRDRNAGRLPDRAPTTRIG